MVLAQAVKKIFVGSYMCLMKTGNRWANNNSLVDRVFQNMIFF